jgi:amidase
MAQEDHREPRRVALIISMPEGETDAVVVEAIRKVGRWLEGTGYIVEESGALASQKPAHLFWDLLMSEECAASENEMAASTKGIELYGDEAVKRNRRGTLAYAKPLSYEEYISGLAPRTTILREWLIFLELFPALIPVSSQFPFVIGFDQLGDESVRQTHLALQPSIAVSLWPRRCLLRRYDSREHPDWGSKSSSVASGRKGALQSARLSSGTPVKTPIGSGFGQKSATANQR